MSLPDVGEDWMHHLTEFISKRENQVEIATYVHHPLKHITDFESNELTLNTTTLGIKPSVVSTNICSKIRSYYENYNPKTTNPELPEVLYMLGKSHHIMLLPESSNKYNEAYAEALSHVEVYHKTKYNGSYRKHGLIKISRISWMAKQISAHDTDQTYFTTDIIARNIALLYIALLNKLFTRDVEDDELAMPEFVIKPRIYALREIVIALQACSALKRCDALDTVKSQFGRSLQNHPNFSEVLLEKITDLFKKHKFGLKDFRELYRVDGNLCVCCDDEARNENCPGKLYVGKTFGMNLHPL